MQSVSTHLIELAEVLQQAVRAGEKAGPKELLSLAEQLTRAARDAVDIEERLVRTELAAIQVAAEAGRALPRMARDAVLSVSALPGLLSTVERTLSGAAHRNEGLDTHQAAGLALLVRGAIPVAKRALARSVECDALEAIARDIDGLDAIQVETPPAAAAPAADAPAGAEVLPFPIAARRTALATPFNPHDGGAA